MNRSRGLSPRWRGNLKAGELVILVNRSIPALAGQPGTVQDIIQGVSVYPRAGGATERSLETMV